MVSTCPLISKYSSPFINPLVTIQSAPYTIGITATFMFHCFCNYLLILDFIIEELANGFSLEFEWQVTSSL